MGRDRALRSIGRARHRPLLTCFIGGSTTFFGQLSHRISTLGRARVSLAEEFLDFLPFPEPDPETS
jgi:hypothetical protein